MKRGYKQIGLRYAILVVLLLLSGCASFDKQHHSYFFQEVFYLTTRADTGFSNLDRRFEGRRGSPSFGMAMVAIDPQKTLSPHAQPQPNHILQQKKMLRRNGLQQILPLPESEFLVSMQRYVEETGPVPEVLIFIHGYRRKFSDSVINAAQFRHELAFSGPVIAFSWPSTYTVGGYTDDIANLEWSIPELTQLVEAIARNMPGARIHILAHSMGNRALVGCLSDIIRSKTDLGDCSLGEILFVAPDFDRTLFIEEVAPMLAHIPSRKTLYVSAEDFPLMTAATLYKYPRLGDSREGVPIVDGIETVDVSDSINLFNGHGYFEADGATIEDFYHLIREGQGAAERSTLIEVESDEGRYWRLKPQE